MQITINTLHLNPVRHSTVFYNKNLPSLTSKTYYRNGLLVRGNISPFACSEDDALAQHPVQLMCPGLKLTTEGSAARLLQIILFIRMKFTKLQSQFICIKKQCTYCTKHFKCKSWLNLIWWLIEWSNKYKYSLYILSYVKDDIVFFLLKCIT